MKVLKYPVRDQGQQLDVRQPLAEAHLLLTEAQAQMLELERTLGIISMNSNFTSSETDPVRAFRSVFPDVSSETVPGNIRMSWKNSYKQEFPIPTPSAGILLRYRLEIISFSELPSSPISQN